MAKQLKQPDWVRHFNQFGPACGGAGFLLPLQADELKKQATSATGLSDFGAVPWEEAFNKLLWSLNNEAGLTTLGRMMCRAELLRTLQLRLRLTAFWQANPQVLEAPVTAPIVIAGAARTGTTILQETLSEDEQFHLPYTWKCYDPLPLGDDPARDKAERIAKASCESDFWIDVQPELHSMHDFGARLPTECIIFMATDYSNDYWSLVADMPEWDAWNMANVDPEDGYLWHKRMLQTMQHGEPEANVWLLKAPSHLARLDALLAVYPDVRIIHTHRDPVKCIPSTASVTTTVRGERSDIVDSKKLGELIAFGFQFAMENVINQREDGRLPKAQVVDVHLQDLIEQPVATIRRVYAHFNLNFPSAMESKIVEYLANKPRGRFGVHKYAMSEFGMDAGALRASFKRYTDYYDVHLES